jgi:hypothetical protein
MDKDKEYLILTRIKSLNGRKKMVLDGEVEDSLPDIEAQIQALTNLLEML